MLPYIGIKKEALIAGSAWVYKVIYMHVNCLIARVLASSHLLVELILFNSRNQCLTEFLKIRTCFKF